MINTELLKNEIASRLRIRAAIAGAVKSVFAKSKPQKPKQVKTYNSIPDRTEAALMAIQAEIKKNIAHGKK